MMVQGSGVQGFMRFNRFWFIRFSGFTKFGDSVNVEPHEPNEPEPN
jgi:hypothetical protein